MVDDAARRRGEIKSALEQKLVTVEEIQKIAPGLEDVFVNVLVGLEEDTISRHKINNSADRIVKEMSLDEAAIEVSNLRRKFGDFTAVDQVSFEVKRGEIFGLLGPNGSGKTTTIRMITGLLEPSAGNAYILGYDMKETSDEAQCRMGYMSQKFSLFSDLTVEENINFYAGLYGLSLSTREERKKWVLDMAGLRGKEKSMPRELSGGWKQRLALGCAVLHDPEVIFLDEPTSGVDPLSRRTFWEFIQELAADGRTIFVTTHYMDEAEHCHRLGLLYQGELIALGSPLQLKTDGVKGELVEMISSDLTRTLELLSADARYCQASFFGSTIHAVVDNAEAASVDIKSMLEDSNITVSSINRIPFTMEDVFMSLVEEQESTLTAKGARKRA